MQLPPISGLGEREFDHLLLTLLERYEHGPGAGLPEGSPERELARELRTRLAVRIEQETDVDRAA